MKNKLIFKLKFTTQKQAENLVILQAENSAYKLNLLHMKMEILSAFVIDMKMMLLKQNLLVLVSMFLLLVVELCELVMMCLEVLAE